MPEVYLSKLLLLPFFVLLVFSCVQATVEVEDDESFGFDSSTQLEFTKYSELSFELKSNVNCSTSCIHGTCDNNKCVCDMFYQGENCNDRFRDNKAWYGLFIIYSIMVILGNLVNLIFASVEMFYAVKKMDNYAFWKWDSVPHLLLCIVLGTSFRVILFAVDPHSERNIVDRVTTQVFLSASVILWLAASFLLVHVWIKVQIASRILGTDRIKFLIPVLPVISIICAVVALPLTVLAEQANIFQTLYNFWMALVFISLIVIMSGVSFRFRQLLKKAQEFGQQHLSQSKSSNGSIYSQLLQKLSWYIMVMNAVLVITILCLIIYIVIDAPANRWKYLIIHTLYRIEEIIMILITLLFLKRRAQSGVSSATANSNQSGSEARLSHFSLNSARVDSFNSTTDLVPDRKVSFSDEGAEMTA